MCLPPLKYRGLHLHHPGGDLAQFVHQHPKQLPRGHRGNVCWSRSSCRLTGWPRQTLPHETDFYLQEAGHICEPQAFPYPRQAGARQPHKWPPPALGERYFVAAFTNPIEKSFPENRKKGIILNKYLFKCTRKKPWKRSRSGAILTFCPLCGL